MDIRTGRPDHIEDYLVTVREGQWYGWSDPNNKIYANLIVHDGGSKPTEAEYDAGFKKLQDDFDALDYSRKRAKEYPKYSEQFDLIYHSGVDAWKAKIKETKDKYPKPS
jgi:hypothetical protein